MVVIVSDRRHAATTTESSISLYTFQVARGLPTRPPWTGCRLTPYRVLKVWYLYISWVNGTCCLGRIGARAAEVPAPCALRAEVDGVQQYYIVIGSYASPRHM